MHDAWDDDGAANAAQTCSSIAPRQSAEGQRAAAVRPRPRPCALQGAVRPGRGPDPRQASADRAVRPADPAAVPGAGDGSRRASGDHRAAAWLAREHAITVLPAVSSLKALRRVARPSAATKPMIGFGNPLLDGIRPIGRGRPSGPSCARDKQACPQTPWQQSGRRCVERRRGVAADRHARRPCRSRSSAVADAAARNGRRAVRGGPRLKADLGRHPARRPRHRARDQGAERAVARSPSTAILHFATHGTLAGEIEGTSEPGLILTPPERADRPRTTAICRPPRSPPSSSTPTG